MLKFDEEVKWILGRPNFAVAPIAHALRLSGQDIKTKFEDEQAAAIYWMLCLYEKHGTGWRDEADKILKEIKGLKGE